jgi:hypothetical protein
VFKNEHVSNGQRMFHGVPRVNILMAKTLTIEIDPMNLEFRKHKNIFFK